MRVRLLFNPSAGKGRAKAKIGVVVDTMRRLGASVDCTASESAEHFADMIRSTSPDEYDRLVVAGGDGTIHIAANAIDLNGSPLAIIPLGSGDDLAKTLGIPTDPAAAAAVALNGSTREIDVAVANGRRYLGVAGVGFDSKVASFANTVRHLSGSLVYLYSIFRVLPSFRPIPMSITIDGHTQYEEVMFAVVANGPRYGGGIRIAPTAELDDRLLDLYLIRRCSKWDLVKTLPKAYTGKHVGSSFVAAQRAREIRIACEEPLELYADGEYATMTPVTITLAPQRLRIAVP
jgi:diacylglycerol kinase (ATP)